MRSDKSGKWVLRHLTLRREVVYVCAPRDAIFSFSIDPDISLAKLFSYRSSAEHFRRFQYVVTDTLRNFEPCEYDQALLEYIAERVR